MADSAIGLGAAFLAGLLTFVSPCVLPLIPVFLSFLTGVADLTGDGAGAPNRKQIFFHVLAFVAGFSAVFVLLGASATALGHVLFEHQDRILRVGGVIVVLFGLFMMGLIPVNFLNRDFRVHLRQKPAGFAGSFIVGAAFGFGWTPCVGPILGSILLMASTSESVWLGMKLLLVYSLGLAVPFLAAALLLENFLRLLRRLRGVLIWVERASGAFLVLVGALMVSGHFSRLTSWIAQGFSSWTDWLIKLGI
jgi:cytochrome c-type biogenesis protein